MKRITMLLLMATLGTTVAFAQATRTWVSGVGDDANPCSRTAPCKTFAGAISKTAPGGEIDALDPGGFGALTITKSITLDGGGGQVASVLVAGTNGIVVAAQPGDKVIIRNLRLDGLLGAGNANAGLDGIKFISGTDLNVENVWVFGFANNCIEAALGSNASVHIINTVTKNCGQDGIRVATTSGIVQVGIDDSQVMLSGGNGVNAADNCRVVINRSFIEHAASAGVNATASAGNTIVTVDHSDISFNGNGVAISGGAQAILADNKVAFNSTSAVSLGAGACNSYGTNRFHNPSLAVSCPLMSPAQQ
jgi:hypothetical protein